MVLKDKTIVLGVTGSIAVYKAADLASQLTRAGARVEVIMTDAATGFVTPLTFRNITGRPVVTTMFDLTSEYSVEHVAVADAADVVVIAPATANTIAKLAAGIADNMLTCTVLATKAPVILAPAMDVNMYDNSITQDNLAKLQARDFTIVGPESGRLASGKMGMGRFIDVNQIIGAICQVLGRNSDLAGKHIVVTAGGTKEPIDPVRCLTNYSSGKMGYALAEAARDRGAQVTLITATTALHQPTRINIVDAGTAQEMYKAVKKATVQADALIMAAAVADFRPAKVSKNKIKRQAATGLTLELEKTVDILAEVKGDFVRVGFAAESDNLIANARDKLQRKQLDLIVANDITIPSSGIGSDKNQVVIIDRKGKAEKLPLLPKREVADKILDRVAEILAGNVTSTKSDHIEHIVTKYDIENKRFRLKTNELSIFPPISAPQTHSVNFIVETDYGNCTEAYITHQKNGFQIKRLDELNNHRELIGEKLIVEVIEPMKRYRLRKA